MHIFSNGFGEVQTDRITFSLKKSWFSGTLKADYPTKHITSISLDTSRRPILGGMCGLAGVTAVVQAPGSPSAGSLIFLGLILILVGIYLLIGRPAIHFATAGGEKIISYGSWPWQKNAAQEFVDAIRKEVFKEVGST